MYKRKMANTTGYEKTKYMVSIYDKTGSSRVINSRLRRTEIHACGAHYYILQVMYGIISKGANIILNILVSKLNITQHLS